MPTIRFITSGHTVTVPDEDADDLNLLRAAIKYGAGLPFRCASGQCGTDRVKVVEGAENLSTMRPASVRRWANWPTDHTGWHARRM